ncbi:LysR family transcriptional regulator [Sedimenticola selenatireducens]|uniref:LysR family transcriptional regulator n=1 Tax=Sedimenticola selenatireducens TaxID=191960 RepID=UPI0004B407D8|nr:LysR family transcriptional regulator [Sedimenticola selenatireducens]
MYMNIRHLEAIVWISRLGSFAAAADKLHLTQPTVSQRVKELENHLGVKLFKRSGRRAILNVRGRALIPLAEQMLGLEQTICKAVGNLTAISGVVRVGVAELIALTWLPTLVAQVNQHYPDINIVIDVDLTGNLWTKFDQRKLDIVLLPSPVTRPYVRSIPLGGTTFSWIASPKLNIPDHVLGPEEISRWPVILLSAKSNIYTITKRWFTEANVNFSNVSLCNNLQTIATLTLNGLGISTLPAEIYQKEIDANKLVVLETTTPLPFINYQAVYQGDQELMLEEIVAKIAGEVSSFHKISPSPDTTG